MYKGFAPFLGYKLTQGALLHRLEKDGRMLDAVQCFKEVTELDRGDTVALEHLERVQQYLASERQVCHVVCCVHANGLEMVIITREIIIIIIIIIIITMMMIRVPSRVFEGYKLVPPKNIVIITGHK